MNPYDYAKWPEWARRVLAQIQALPEIENGEVRP